MEPMTLLPAPLTVSSPRGDGSVVFARGRIVLTHASHVLDLSGMDMYTSSKLFYNCGSLKKELKEHLSIVDDIL